MPHRPSTLETVTGRFVDLNEPDPESICIEDIAWGLSRISRFGGQTMTLVPYNVASHSIFVAEEVECFLRQNYSEYDDDMGASRSKIALYALLHDAAEAYLGDWPSPLKRIPKLKLVIEQIEFRMMTAIYERFDLEIPSKEISNIIKMADLKALKIEANAFMNSRGKGWSNMPVVTLEELQQFSPPVPAIEAYKKFMLKFESLR